MVGIALHWVRRFDVDGFRVDAAWAVGERCPDAWREWRRRLEQAAGRDLLLIAESAPDDPGVVGDFDIAYDWEGGPGDWAWADAWGGSATETVAALRSALEATRGERRLRFLNTNDSGERFAERHGPALAKLAAVVQLTVPGAPLVFAGDEIGAAFEAYSEPAEMPWRDRHGLDPLYRRLLTLRRELLVGGPELRLLETGDPEVLAYAVGAGEPTLVGVNFGRDAAQVVLSGDLPPKTAQDMLRQFPSVRVRRVESALELTLPGQSAAIVAGQ
jgi:glycosidase